jgi:hypothetical protein
MERKPAQGHCPGRGLLFHARKAREFPGFAMAETADFL